MKTNKLPWIILITGAISAAGLPTISFLHNQNEKSVVVKPIKVPGQKLIIKPPF